MKCLPYSSVAAIHWLQRAWSRDGEVVDEADLEGILKTGLYPRVFEPDTSNDDSYGSALHMARTDVSREGGGLPKQAFNLCPHHFYDNFQR